MANFSQIRSDMPLSRHQIASVTPSVMATEAHESRSARYRPVATVDVLDALANEGFYPFSAAQHRVRDESRREFSKHMLRLRHLDRPANDEVMPEIILVNSFDGSSSFQLIAGMFRFVCANGLILGDKAAEVRIQHSGRIVEHAVQGAYRIAASFDAMLEAKALLGQHNMMADERLEFAKRAMVIRYGNTLDAWKEDDKELVARQLLRYWRPADAGNDAWSVYNRVQENIMRGNTRSPVTGRRARSITAIDSDLSLNRKLWNIAADMTGVKLAA